MRFELLEVVVLLEAHLLRDLLVHALGVRHGDSEFCARCLSNPEVGSRRQLNRWGERERERVKALRRKRVGEAMRTFATARAKARPETIWNACFKNVSEWDKWDPDIKKVS